jgi:hypothetical protein
MERDGVAHETARCLEQALARLRPEHWEVLLLSQIERLPNREISRRLERSVSAAKSRLARAIRWLGVARGGMERIGMPTCVFRMAFTGTQKQPNLASTRHRSGGLGGGSPGA